MSILPAGELIVNMIVLASFQYDDWFGYCLSGSFINGIMLSNDFRFIACLL